MSTTLKAGTLVRINGHLAIFTLIGITDDHKPQYKFIALGGNRYSDETFVGAYPFKTTVANILKEMGLNESVVEILGEPTWPN